MPNLDGGHYFLTVLAPVRIDTMTDPIVGRSRSHEHLLAQKLALLHTGRQTELSPPNGKPSPFALNTQNHFARFVIINNPAFNGRVAGDTLASLIRRIDPLTPQSVDRLTKPYLLFGADIDAPEGEASVRTYTDTLWRTVNHDLKVIFGHCEGFDEVDTPEEFHAYIRKCQVETTMPFNDYWAEVPKPADPKKPEAADSNKLVLNDAKLPTATLLSLGKATPVALAIWLLALYANALVSLFGGSAQWLASITSWGAVLIPVMIALLLLIVCGLYRSVLRRAQSPLPTAPQSDLPSVLKSLFVQQRFTQFAIDVQGLDDDPLYARFGEYLADVLPADAEPTQTPGEVFSPKEPPAELKVA